MRYVVQFAIFLGVALFLGLAFSAVHTVVFEDALLDFLDKATVARNKEYLESTEYSRAAGFAMLLLLGGGIALGLDRLVEAAWRRTPRGDA
jgi:hypothetical protein